MLSLRWRRFEPGPGLNAQRQSPIAVPRRNDCRSDRRQVLARHKTTADSTYTVKGGAKRD